MLASFRLSSPSAVAEASRHSAGLKIATFLFYIFFFKGFFVLILNDNAYFLFLATASASATSATVKCYELLVIGYFDRLLRLNWTSMQVRSQSIKCVSLLCFLIYWLNKVEKVSAILVSLRNLPELTPRILPPCLWSTLLSRYPFIRTAFTVSSRTDREGKWAQRRREEANCEGFPREPAALWVRSEHLDR